MLVKLTDISLVYLEGSPAATDALTDVSFTLESGEFAAVIGRTGSGKSTLTQIMAGLLRPSAGSVELDGVDLWSDRASRSHLRDLVGLVMQEPERQLFETTVAADVAFWPKNSGWAGPEIEAAVEAALRRVGLDIQKYGERSPFSLSGGEKRRVAMAGVLVMDPPLLILDEPTVGLDPRGRQELLEYLRGLNQAGTTILMITHDLDIVAESAGRVLGFEAGRLIDDTTPSALFSQRAKTDQELATAPTVAKRLAEKGFLLDDEPLTVDELADSIIKVFPGAPA